MKMVEVKPYVKKKIMFPKMIKNIVGHFKTVCTHKWYVFQNCAAAGMPIRGILHDLSKFSPTEFMESVKYYQGTSSPIDASKKANGYSEAWMHHKGRNRHHYEFWQDNFDNGGHPVQMPYKDALELVCDYLGAGQAYEKDAFTYEGEYQWWLRKISKPIAMHPQTKLFVDMMLRRMAKDGSNNALNAKTSRMIYKMAEREYLNK